MGQIFFICLWSQRNIICFHRFCFQLLRSPEVWGGDFLIQIIIFSNNLNVRKLRCLTVQLSQSTWNLFFIHAKVHELEIFMTPIIYFLTQKMHELRTFDKIHNLECFTLLLLRLSRNSFFIHSEAIDLVIIIKTSM